MKNVTSRIAGHKAEVYQTRHYTPEQIRKLRERAEGQEKKIARYFCKHPRQAFGPAQIHRIFFPEAPVAQDWDLNSTRRAITNLTDDGILVQTDQTRGTWRGGTEHKWMWRWPQEPAQADMFGEPKSKSQSKAYDL